MPRTKRVISDTEKRQLMEPIIPQNCRWEKMFHECVEQLEITEFSLNNMATKMEWQYDKNLDRDKPTHYPEEGVITVSSENSHFIYKVTAPLIHKRVKVAIPEKDFKKFELIVSVYHLHLSNCFALAKLLGFRFERKQIVDMMVKRG